jgi:uncharacterized protein DUF6011
MMEEKMTQVTLAQEIAAVAAGRVHKLAAYQVDGQHEIAPGQYRGIMTYLLRCPERPTPEENVARHEAYQAEAEHARHAAGPVIADIPAGFFATPSRTGNNDFDFWKVTEGRRAGIRFVKRVIGGGDLKYPRLEPVTKGEQMAALGAILRAGIEKSRNDYADNQQRCMRCGLHLTDEESRAARMGPVCREK